MSQRSAASSCTMTVPSLLTGGGHHSVLPGDALSSVDVHRMGHDERDELRRTATGPLAIDFGRESFHRCMAKQDCSAVVWSCARGYNITTQGETCSAAVGCIKQVVRDDHRMAAVKHDTIRCKTLRTMSRMTPRLRNKRRSRVADVSLAADPCRRYLQPTSPGPYRRCVLWHAYRRARRETATSSFACT